MTRPADRDLDLRLARLHLRGGQHAIARAELEALAGADRLDDDAILDLAEVRWRTGDLQGAATAAAAWLDDARPAPDPGADPAAFAAGGSAPSVGGAALAHAIRAEAAAAEGRAAEAAAHVEAAAALIGDGATLDLLLAGIPARGPWPWPGEPAVDAVPGGAGPGAGGGDDRAPAVPEAAAEPGAHRERAAEAGSTEPAAAGASWRASAIPMTGPAAELVRSGTALLAAAPARAAVLFSLALRTDRAAAEPVLAALDAAAGETAAGSADVAAAGSAEVAAAEAAPAIAFVRAEALRAAGRHDAARIAYAAAEHLALAPAEAGPQRSSP